ncbi:MAG: leucyl aminopeptidase [Paenibacillaceae bacterium]
MKHTETIFSVKQTDLSGYDGWVLFLRKQELEHLVWLEPKLGETIRRLKEQKLFTGALHEVELIPTHGLFPTPYLVLIGLGDSSPTPLQAWREAAAVAAKVALKTHLSRLAVRLIGVNADENLDVHTKSHIAAALTEGFLLGSYRIKSYQRDLEVNTSLLEVAYYDDSEQMITGEVELEEAIHNAIVYAEATNYARDLTNLPSNLLTPENLAEEAQKLASLYGFECIIHNELEIEKLKMSGLHHVGKGSVHPPRMIVLKYQGQEQWTDVLGLVGKGITFDTGGISLKDPAGMEEMISDMGGSAVLLGVMQAIGKLKPKINVVVVIPAAENMPSGSAYKPGDVIPTLSGRTVEVLNTDAEGRIVLADGVTYAKQLGATRIIDIATLTGAVLVALGDVATAAITNDESFLKQLLKTADQNGEKVWQLPVYPEYKEMLKSEIADVKNSTAKRWAGAITGGLFVGTFAEETPWIHLDTGGTAWLWHERGLDPKGGTGAMVRTLIAMVCG